MNSRRRSRRHGSTAPPFKTCNPDSFPFLHTPNWKCYCTKNANGAKISVILLPQGHLPHFLKQTHLHDFMLRRNNYSTSKKRASEARGSAAFHCWCELSSSPAGLLCEFCSGFSVLDMEIILAKEKADTVVWARPAGLEKGRGVPFIDEHTLLLPYPVDIQVRPPQDSTK